MRKNASSFVKGMAVTCAVAGIYALAPPITASAAQSAGFSASMESFLGSEQDSGISDIERNAGITSSMLDSIADDTINQTDVQMLEAAADVQNNTICGYTNLGIANAKKPLKVRKGIGDDKKLAGELPKNAGCEVLKTKGKWSKIRSGEVIGWVKSRQILTGESAVKRAEKVMDVKAVASTDGINMRQKPDMECDVQAVLDEGSMVSVVENLGEWVKVKSGDTESYVLSESIDISESLPVARSAEDIAREEEEKRRAEEERRAEQARQEEARNVQEPVEKEVQKPKKYVSKDVSKTRRDLVNYALKFVGNPYVWGGTSLTHGVDCSGFTMKVYGKFGISLPHHAASQACRGTGISASEMRPGDLVFYSNGGGINHVALYIGNRQVVHASNPSTGIKISTYNYRTPAKIISLLK